MWPLRMQGLLLTWVPAQIQLHYKLTSKAVDLEHMALATVSMSFVYSKGGRIRYNVKHPIFQAKAMHVAWRCYWLAYKCCHLPA